jgi:hypothetical protein
MSAPESIELPSFGATAQAVVLFCFGDPRVAQSVGVPAPTHQRNGCCRSGNPAPAGRAATTAYQWNYQEGKLQLNIPDSTDTPDPSATAKCRSAVLFCGSDAHSGVRRRANAHNGFHQ